MVMVGCFAGTIIGMLPGLGPMTAIALMIPITYGFDPSTGLILMAGVYYGAVFGGSTSSILLNAPGIPGTVATAFDENAPFNARTFPIYLGWAGIILSSLKIILPEKVTTEVNHKHLDYKSIIYLIIISLIYAAVILKIGYFISTSLFLFASYYFLGERRWGLMFILSFPFVAAFMYLLHGLLNIYLRDPFLKYIGVMG